MTEFFDSLDTQDPVEREHALFEQWAATMPAVLASCPGLARHLDGVDVAAVTSRDALIQVPVLRKSALMEAQQLEPPFGGFVNPEALPGARVFMSPGPVWEPQVSGVDAWRASRSLHAAGLRSGDRVHNAFSYHLTPGGFILDEGARALGCAVFPAGVGNTDAQVDALHTFAAKAYIGTPDFLQVLLDRARDRDIPLPALTHAMVSGGALFPAMREAYVQAGIHVQQCYATADLGVIAYETATDGSVHPGMLVNEELIVEILRPGTGVPAEPGEVGELVVTRLHPDYPLVRFATGDLSMFLSEPSPCGRTQLRIAGWMGRADQRTKFRGMFIDPAQMQALRDAHPELSRVRLCVTHRNGRDEMCLRVNSAANAPDTVDVDGVAATLKRLTGLSGEVQRESEELPNDGVVIDDLRDYST